MKLVATRFGDDVYDAAFRLAVLWFETAGLYLNFFDERSQNAGTQRTIGTRERAQTAERGIGDVNAISNVEVVEG